MKKVEKSMKKRVVGLMKLLLTGLFLYLLWRMADQQSLLMYLGQVDALYLVLYAVLGLAMLLASNAKWHVLMGIHGRRPGFWGALRIYFIGYYFSALLPSNFGGDAVRIYLAGQACGSSTAAATSVFMERVTGLVVLLALVAIVPLIGPAFLQHPAFIVPSVICGGALALMLMAAFFHRRLATLLQAVSGWLRAWPRTNRLAPILDWLGRFFMDSGEALAAVTRNRRIALLVWSLTGLFYLIAWLSIVIAYWTFSVTPPVEFVFATPAVQFMISLPVSAGGNLGYSEGVFVYYFALAGIAVEATVAVAILIRLKTWLFGLIGMVLFLVGGHQNALRNREGAKPADEALSATKSPGTAQ